MDYGRESSLVLTKILVLLSVSVVSFVFIVLGLLRHTLQGDLGIFQIAFQIQQESVHFFGT